jgi:tRNA nucleotidyltransferase/poly(A) polymerase
MLDGNPDSVPVFLLGVRDTPADQFQYLRIPADPEGKKTTFLMVRDMLKDPVRREEAVRRYVRDAGPLLTHLHVLTRADCTTRNARKAARLAATYDSLEDRIAILMEQEELSKIRPDLDGAEVMSLLGIKPGADVGRALDFLLELRMDQGPLGKEKATELLLDWWAKKNG